MRKFLSFFLTALAAFSLMVIVGGCGSDSLAPYEPEIHNNPDKFEFQATGVTNLSRTYTYTWSNSGLLAAVDHSTVATSGTVTLKVMDDAVVEVYSRDLTVDGVFDTATGQAGQWTVRVIFTNFSGTVNFRVEKK